MAGGGRWGNRFRRRRTAPTLESFAALIDRAKRHDPDAIGLLYRNHVAMVYGYLVACRAPEPEDLTSDVFVGMLRSLPSFDGTQPEFRRWLMTIAYRRLIDQRRRSTAGRRRPAGSELVDGVEHPEVDTRPVVLDAELVAAFGELTDAQREVLGLRFVADLSLEGVCAVTGRSLTAVKGLQDRGLRALRRHLTDPVETRHA